MHDDFTPAERNILRSLDTPRKLQLFLNKIPINFEEHGETCYSPRLVLRHRRAHCMEGALLAAAALRMHGFPPLVVDLHVADHDLDHVVAVFRQHGRWGAISKTNHAVLRYRDPVYKSIRELVMSYFHEYFDDKGRKTLRSFTLPVDLSRFDAQGWMTAEDEVWYIPEYLADVRHYPVMGRKHLALLKRSDKIELDYSGFTEWGRDRRKMKYRCEKIK